MGKPVYSCKVLEEYSNTAVSHVLISATTQIFTLRNLPSSHVLIPSYLREIKKLVCQEFTDELTVQWSSEYVPEEVGEYSLIILNSLVSYKNHYRNFNIFGKIQEDLALWIGSIAELVFRHKSCRSKVAHLALSLSALLVLEEATSEEPDLDLMEQQFHMLLKQTEIEKANPISAARTLDTFTLFTDSILEKDPVIFLFSFKQIPVPLTLCRLSSTAFWRSYLQTFNMPSLVICLVKNVCITSLLYASKLNKHQIPLRSLNKYMLFQDSFS